jgi:hypothetical protein
MALRVITGLAAPMPPVPVPPPSNKLAIPPVLQSGKNWCWAACAEMAVRYAKATAVAQCDFASWLVPGGGCCGVIPPAVHCDQPCPSSQIASIYVNWNVAATGSQKQISFAKIQNEINASRPVQISFQYGGGTGHAILVSGWTAIPGSYTVDVLDPNQSRASALYIDLQTAFGTGGVWDWTWVDLS